MQRDHKGTNMEEDISGPRFRSCWRGCGYSPLRMRSVCCWGAEAWAASKDHLLRQQWNSWATEHWDSDKTLWRATHQGPLELIRMPLLGCRESSEGPLFPDVPCATRASMLQEQEAEKPTAGDNASSSYIFSPLFTLAMLYIFPTGKGEMFTGSGSSVTKQDRYRWVWSWEATHWEQTGWLSSRLLHWLYDAAEPNPKSN